MLKNFDEVIEKVRSIEPFTVSVAAAADKELLQAVKAAADLGFVRPVLVGDAKAVGDICADIGLRPLDILPAQGEEEAVAVAVRAVKDGGAQVLMKGLVNTSIYMRGILNKEHGLRTGRLLSMMAVYEAPGYHKLVYCSDSGINVAPTFEQKKDILKNILIATRAIGLENPKVAALTANEMVDPKIQSTVDAAGLVEYARSGELGLPCVIEGPIAFDVAFDPLGGYRPGRDQPGDFGLPGRHSGDQTQLHRSGLPGRAELSRRLCSMTRHLREGRRAGISPTQSKEREEYP